MLALQLHAHHDATSCGAEAPLQFGALSSCGFASLLYHAVRVDWPYAVSPRVRTRAATSGRHRYPTSWASSWHSHVREHISEDLEWAFTVAREVIGTHDRREETRYNDHGVEMLFKPGVFMRVLQHGRNYAALPKLVPHYSELCEVMAVRGPILTLWELDTRRQFTANHDAVRLSSLTPNRLFVASPPLPNTNDRAPSPPPNACHREPSPLPSLTLPHLPSASPAIDDDVLLALSPVAAFQHQATLDAQLDADALPQRRRNPSPYLDDYGVSPFQWAYNIECAKLFESQFQISDDVQLMRSTSSSQLSDVHSSQQSNHDVSLHQNTNPNDDNTIEFIYLSDDSVPVPVPSYSYSVTSSVENYVKPVSFPSPGSHFSSYCTTPVSTTETTSNANAAVRERA